MSNELLIVHTAITILGVLVLVVWAKLNPVVVLVIGAVYLGLAGGLGFEETALAVSTGFGNLMAEVGLIIGFGVLLGSLLSQMGTLQRVVGLILRAVGVRRSPYALGLSAGVVLPAIYFDVALVMLAPMARQLGDRGRRSVVHMAGSLAIGLEAGLLMVLPGAAALATAAALDVPLGQMLLWGIPFAIVGVIVSTFLHAAITSRTWNPARDEDATSAGGFELPGAQADPVTEGGGGTATRTATRPAPAVEGAPARGVVEVRRSYPLAVALLPVLVPVLLIVAYTVSDAAGVGSPLLQFLGNPVIALLLGLLVATALAVPAMGRDGVEETVSAGASATGVIILFTGVAGSLGEVITEVGVGDILAGLFSANSALPLLLAWLVAAALRIAQGSATVAAITAAALLAPILGDIGSPAVLVALAAASGAAFGAQVSDNSFWMFKALFGLTTRGTFQAYTLAQSTLAVVGLGLVLLADLVV